LRDDLIASGALETDGRGHMTSSARHKFSRAMVALRGKHGALREHNGVVWRVGAAARRERAVASARSPKSGLPTSPPSPSATGR
jgi:hypothetical protein